MLQSNKATKQQSNKATKQQSNKATKIVFQYREALLNILMLIYAIEKQYFTLSAFS